TPAVESEKTEKSPELARPAGWQGSVGQGLPLVQWPAPAPNAVEPPPARPIPWPQELPMPEITAPNLSQVTTQHAERKSATEASRETKTQRAGDLSEGQEAVGPTGRSGVGGIPQTNHMQDAGGADALNRTLIQAACILGVAIVAPVVSIVC